MRINQFIAIGATQKTWVVGLVLSLFILDSCVTTKKTTYLQDYKKSEISGEFDAPKTYIIQPNDNLYIHVSTLDPELAVMFNLMQTESGTRVDEASASLMSYSVQLDGTVQIPYLGTIVVAGKTLSEAKAAIDAILVDYVSDASISIKLVNNYVSILGEVNSPGLYPIYKDRLNIFQALSMAGDMSEYSDRYRLRIVRQTVEGSIVKEFDLTDKNIVDSEFYYVMPNDIIYAKPMKGKFFGFNQFPYALIVTTITTAILIDSYLSQ